MKPLVLLILETVAWLVAIAIAGVCAFAIASLISCSASLAGSATEKSDAYFLQCGADRCDPEYYACSVRAPYHCEFQGRAMKRNPRDGKTVKP